jgi:hypothetical protein
MPPMKTKTKPSTAVADAIADELDGLDDLDELDAAADELTNETAHTEEVEVNLAALDLAGVIESDFRLLVNGCWYDAECVKAVGSYSAAGNLQTEITWMVTGEGVDGDGQPAEGVTITDYAGVDPRQPKQHWKIKKIAKRVGLLGANDQLATKHLTDFLGRRARLQVQIDTGYDANGRNKVNDYGYPTEPNPVFAASA